MSTEKSDVLENQSHGSIVSDVDRSPMNEQPQCSEQQYDSQGCEIFDVPGCINAITQSFSEKWKLTSNGCWIWISSTRDRYYGSFTLNGKRQQAHRVSWQLYRGEIPDGLCVLHDCDTPLCVNPNHLHLGTEKDNAIEAVERGLWGDKAGESNGNSKLTTDQIREIRESPDSYRTIAIRFGIGKSQVGNIKTGAQWKNL